MPTLTNHQENLFSFSEILRAPRPKIFIEEKLTQLLKRRFKELHIVWSPEAFRGGLSNSELPKPLLRKLESLIGVSEASGWDVSSALKRELDETVEDIETFNLAFRKRLAREHKAATRDLEAGHTISMKELKQQLGF